MPSRKMKAKPLQSIREGKRVDFRRSEEKRVLAAWRTTYSQHTADIQQFVRRTGNICILLRIFNDLQDKVFSAEMSKGCCLLRDYF